MKLAINAVQYENIDSIYDGLDTNIHTCDVIVRCL